MPFTPDPFDLAELVFKDSSTNTTLGSIPVVVIVPSNLNPLKKDEAEYDDSITGVNKGLRPNTVPAFHPQSGADEVELATLWCFDTKIYVLDQFDKPLDDMYVGAKISEEGGAINVGVQSGGWYSDFVGHKETSDIIPYDAAAVASWESLTTKTLDDDQEFVIANHRVEVGGHTIGILKRALNFYSNAGPPRKYRLEIIWIKP